MFTNLCVSHDICHVSQVTCHMSHVMCNVSNVRCRQKSLLDCARDKLYSTLQQSVLCKLSFLFVPGSPKTPLDMSKWDLKIILFVSNMSGGFF